MTFIYLKSFSLKKRWAIEVRLDNSEIILTVLNGCAASVTNCIAKTKYSNLKRDGLDLIEKLINILIKGILLKKQKNNLLINSSFPTRINK